MVLLLRMAYCRDILIAQTAQVADAMLQEPADPSDEIYQHPNVIATPHTGVASLEVLEQLVSVVCNNIVRRREGKELLHRLC